jgi:hypothetical protein
MKTIQLLVLLLVGSTALQAGECDIFSLRQNGRLTFTNASTNALYTIEWASAVRTITNLNGTDFWCWEGDAHDSWDGLRSFVVTNQTATVEVPMFYRVRAETNTYNSASLIGAWFITFPDSENPYTYMVFDGAHTITDYGAFDKGDPAGYYSVHADGSFVVGVFVVPDSEPKWQGFLVGRLDTPTKGRCWKAFYGEDLYNIDEGLCQGHWVGEIVNTNSPPGTHSVSFTVLPSGQVTSFTGFAQPVAGRMLADSNGNAVAFFWTGENNDDREMRIHGILSGETVVGRYRNDGNGAGPVNLSRQ